jgi:hypothetical protein
MIKIITIMLVLNITSFAFASGKQVRFPSPTVEICEVEPDSEICEDLEDDE